MDNKFQSILEKGEKTPAQFDLRFMSIGDLLEFSNELINRAKTELTAEISEAQKEQYLTRQEVKEICGVCDATLWHWNKKNYLKAIKVGSKVRYKMSDIRRILDTHSK